MFHTYVDEGDAVIYEDDFMQEPTDPIDLMNDSSQTPEPAEPEVPEETTTALDWSTEPSVEPTLPTEPTESTPTVSTSSTVSTSTTSVSTTFTTSTESTTSIPPTVPIDESTEPAHTTGSSTAEPITDPSGPIEDEDDDGLSTTAKAMIGIFVPLGVIGLGAAGYFAFTTFVKGPSVAPDLARVNQ